MGRWQPDSRGRLQEAALALYAEQGFDQTTAAEIADRAGLTERTFFRHFADKREVLFGGSQILKERIVRGVTERTFFRHFADKREVLFGGAALLGERIVEGVANAPAGDGPLDAVSRGLDAAADFLGQSRRDLARQRQAVIAANSELRERELIKLASLATALAEALRERGVDDVTASLAAEAGIAAFKVAFEVWVQQPTKRNLPRLVRDSVEQLRAVVFQS